MQIFLRIPVGLVGDQVNTLAASESQLNLIKFMHSYAKNSMIPSKEEIAFLNMLLEYYDVLSVDPRDYPDLAYMR